MQYSYCTAMNKSTLWRRKGKFSLIYNTWQAELYMNNLSLSVNVKASRLIKNLWTICSTYQPTHTHTHTHTHTYTHTHIKCRRGTPLFYYFPLSHSHFLWERKTEREITRKYVQTRLQLSIILIILNDVPHVASTSTHLSWKHWRRFGGNPVTITIWNETVSGRCIPLHKTHL